MTFVPAVPLREDFVNEHEDSMKCVGVHTSRRENFEKFKKIGTHQFHALLVSLA